MSNLNIRSKIRPFRHFATYNTGWGKDQTFDDIYAVLAPYAVKLFRKYGAFTNEIPDALQRGFMAFWEQLSANPDMLATMSKTQAVSIILNRGGISIERRRKKRYASLEDLATESSDFEDFALTGLESDRSERWAAWATAADYRIDIECIMTRLALKYQNMSRYLFALYAVTTSVTITDAAAALGMNMKHFAEVYVKEVREEVQREFAAIYQPPKEWIEKYRSGHVAPAKRVLERHLDNPNYVAAIRSLLDEQLPDVAAAQYRVKPGTIRACRTRARKELAAAYGG